MQALSAAPSAGTEPEPSYSPSVSEDEVPPESLPRLRRRNETADVDAVAMLLGLSQYEDDGSSAPNPRNNTAPSNRPKRPFPGAKATTSGPLSKSSEMTKKGATRMGPGDNRVRPPKAATKLLPEAKWRHIRLPDVQSALEAEDIVVLWGHYKYPEALPRSKAEGHLNFLWRHYKDSQLKILLEPIQTAFELENFLKDRYGVGTSTKKPRTTATNGGTSNTTTSNPSVPPLPPVQVTAAAINALPPMNGGTSAGVSPGGVNGGNLVEKRRTLSRQPSSFEKQQQQLTSSPSPIPPPPPPPPRNNATTTENGTINRQSSKEMAGLLYIGAGLTDNNNQEMHTSESPAENGNIGSGEDTNANNALNQPRSAKIKQEEVEELERKPTAAAAAGPAAVARGQQKQQQQQQQDFNLAAATTAALGAGTKATKATNTIGNNNDNNNNTAAPPPPAAAAATAATASAMLDPATASFLAAAAANGIQMPPGLSFPGMMHPAWGNLLANPLAWQFAGGASSANVGAAGVLPSSNNAEDATNAANAAAISQQMASMFPGLQFPGAFAALGGFHGMPPLHPSTAAAAAAAAAAAGIDPTGLLPGATLPNTTIVTPKTEGKSNASTARDARASNEGTGGKYNTGDRPGRPPSYDIMVRWCVNLKRCLWQRHVPLTIEEAVTMVNDPALCARPPALSEKSRVLVASTLRKRVLGIYKITWSQVATDADPGLHDEVKDASVHAAAGIKLKRHGMEPGRTSNGTGGINNNSGSASRPAVVTGGGSGVPGSGMMLPAGLLSSNPSPDEISAFAMASTAATTAVTTTGPAAAATRATRQQNVKKEEPLDLLTTNTSSKDLSQAATVAREAALAAAAATTTQLQGSNLGAALPQLPPMSSSLEDMRNAMGLEIEVKELSPGATAVAAQVPDPSAMKDMLKLMQQQQQGNRTTVAAAAAAAVDNNQINQVNSGGAGGETAVGEAAVNGTEGNFNSIDLPSLASLERAMGSVDGLDIIDAPPAPAVANGGSGEIHAEERKLHLEAFRTKFATVDTTDSDGMFGAMCDLHHVAGITKQECAAICRLWLENVLNDSQKKQLFMYIKANIKEEDLVADWVKSFIRKHGG